jgi:hypothetical protein
VKINNQRFIGVGILFSLSALEVLSSNLRRILGSYFLSTRILEVANRIEIICGNPKARHK